MATSAKLSKWRNPDFISLANRGDVSWDRGGVEAGQRRFRSCVQLHGAPAATSIAAHRQPAQTTAGAGRSACARLNHRAEWRGGERRAPGQGAPLHSRAALPRHALGDHCRCRKSSLRPHIAAQGARSRIRNRHAGAGSVENAPWPLCHSYKALLLHDAHSVAWSTFAIPFADLPRQLCWRGGDLTSLAADPR